MSLSKPKQTTISPVKRYFKWNAELGQITYYDSQTQLNIPHEGVFKMIPVDQLSCVEGYNAKAGKGFRSNEVRSLSKEDLTIVWQGGGPELSGKYKDIKDKLEVLGGRYYSSIYFTHEINGVLELCNLRIKGAAVSSWVKFTNNKFANLVGQVVSISKSELLKTGKVEYYAPVFTPSKSTQKEFDESVKLDESLQEYLTNRVNVKDMVLTDEEKTKLVPPSKGKTKTDDVLNIDDFDFN